MIETSSLEMWYSRDRCGRQTLHAEMMKAIPYTSGGNYSWCSDDDFFNPQTPKPTVVVKTSNNTWEVLVETKPKEIDWFAVNREFS